MCYNFPKQPSEMKMNTKSPPLSMRPIQAVLVPRVLRSIVIYFIHTEIFASNFACEKAFRILLPPIREAKRVFHT